MGYGDTDMESYGDVWGHIGSYGNIWGPMGTYGDVWGHLGPFVDLWGHLGPEGEAVAAVHDGKCAVTSAVTNGTRCHPITYGVTL